MLVQLTYASRAAGDVTPAVVHAILDSSRRHNEAAGITGALCLANGVFLQILEGEREALNRLYRRILADARHTDCLVIDYAEIGARTFTQWAMGLVTHTAENREIFIRYSDAREFNPFGMNAQSVRMFFAELRSNVRWLK